MKFANEINAKANKAASGQRYMFMERNDKLVPSGRRKYNQMVSNEIQMHDQVKNEEPVNVGRTIYKARKREQ